MAARSTQEIPKCPARLGTVVASQVNEVSKITLDQRWKSRDHFLGVVNRPVGDAFTVSSGGNLTSGLCPCPSQEAASSAARTQGGAKTLAAVDDAVVSGASLPRPLPPSPLREEAASRGEPRSSRAGRPRYLTLRFWKRGNNT
ncbi:hypothetical protein ISCGN_020124 [Ixodes scapularis]